MDRLACGLVAASLMTLAACSRDPATRTREYIASGDAFARAGKYREASVEYRNAIKITPTSAEAHEKLADAAARAQDPQTAAGAILRIADLKPGDPAAQIRAASLLLLAGRYEDARDRAVAAVESDRADANAHLVLAQALAGLHDAARSEKELREAARLAPDAPEPLVAIGSFHWAAGRTADAEAAFRKAVALGPQHVAANQALALFFMATGRPANAEPLWRVVSASPQGLPFALVDYLVAMNRLPDAEQALRDLIAHEPTRDAASVRLAAVQYAREQRENAHATLRAMLERNPRSVPALLLQARFFQVEQKLDAALRAAQAAGAADPTHADAALVEGEIQASLGDDVLALRAFEKASRLNPKDASPHLAIARLRMRQGQANDAVMAAERAAALRPDDLAPHLLLIEALTTGGQRARAIEEAQSSVARWPKAVPLHVQLAGLEAAEGQTEQARRELTTALEIEPTSIAALAALAELDLRAGRSQAALATIDNRLRRQPDDPALLILSARTHAAAGQNDKAEATLRRLVHDNPSNLEAFSALGRLYLATGRLDDAREQFERIARDDKKAGAGTMVGMILEAQHRQDEAQRAFERALETNPRAGVAANNLAWLYQERGRLDDALRWALVAKDELRNMPEAKDTLGWIHVRREEYGDALPLLSSIVEARPDSSLYRYHLGYAYWKTGALVRAQEQLRRALASKDSFAARKDAERVLGEIEANARQASR